MFVGKIVCALGDVTLRKRPLLDVCVYCVQTQQGRVSTASIQQGGRRRQMLAETPSAAPSAAPTSASGSPQSAGTASGYFGSGPFARTLNSASNLGVTSGNQYVITSNVQVDGSIR